MSISCMLTSDLIVEVFLILRKVFFDDSGKSFVFNLRDKKDTQDDPLDEYIVKMISEEAKGFVCQKSPGPLISPDFVVFKPDKINNICRENLKNDLNKIIGIEVKKLERSSDNGKIARNTGLDYNTTPPCGLIRIYDENNIYLDIRGFYLFVCKEKNDKNEDFLSALALCDGNILNEDFDLYLSITSQRVKEVNLGTYGDGVNRNRPMLIFSNPLGASQLDYSSTLVIDKELSGDSRIGLVYKIIREMPNGSSKEFFAYRLSVDIPKNWEVTKIIDPFPLPKGRNNKTQGRGKFRVPISISKESRY